MHLVDPLKQPQRFVQQADALLRQGAAAPQGPDPFAAIDASLDASFDAVLARMAPQPPAQPAATPAEAPAAAHEVLVAPPAQYPWLAPGRLSELSPPMSYWQVDAAPPMSNAFPLSRSLPGGVSSVLQHSRLDPLVQEMSAKYHVPEWLVHNVMQAESGGNPLATSPVGAMGLMQLMPETARDLGVADPYDPRQNLEGGVKYLRRMLDTFGGDMTKAVAAYNAGPGNVAQYGGVPPFAETRAYVNKILGGINSQE